MDTALTYALIAAFFGAMAGGLTQFLLDRRRERARVRALVLLTKLELDDVARRLGRAKEEGAWWTSPLESPTWNDHRVEIATALTEHSLVTVYSAFKWFGAANASALEANSRPRLRSSSPPDPFWLNTLSQLVNIASGTLATVAEGGGIIRKSKVPYCLAPELGERCTCGHIFGQHRWAATKRRLRMSHLRVGWADVGYECQACECASYQYDGDRHAVIRLLRRARLLAPVPYLAPGGSEPAAHATWVTYIRNRT